MFSEDLWCTLTKATATPTDLLTKRCPDNTAKKNDQKPNHKTVFYSNMCQTRLGENNQNYFATARETQICQQQFQFLSSLCAFKTKIFLPAHLGFHTIKLIPEEV